MNALFGREKMLRKDDSGIILTVLLVGTLVLSFNIQPAETSPTTIIVPDDYSTIQEAGETSIVIGENYTLDRDITFRGSGFIVAAHNVTLDLNYHTITGTGKGTGISLFDVEEVTVRNGEIKNFSYGIHMQNSNHNTFIDNKLRENTGYGILISWSERNTLRRNNISDNDYNFRVRGDELVHLIHDIDASNIVNGKPIYYWINQRNKQIPVNAGYVNVINSTGIIVRDMTFSRNYESVVLAYTNNSVVENLTVADNYCGVLIHNSHSNRIVDNTLTNSTSGISMELSSYNTIDQNFIANSSLIGISCSHSDHNNFARNTLISNWDGFAILYSTRNTLQANRITLSHQYNFAVEGGLLLDYFHDIDGSNTIDEKPIYYYLNQHDEIIPNDAGYVAAVNSTKITAQNLNLTKNGQGIIFVNTCKSVIANITSSKNNIGILMRWSICNEVRGNSLESNDIGINLDRSNRIFIFENNVTSSQYGIYISSGSNNTIFHNTLTDNTSGVSMSFSVHNYVLKNKVSGIEIYESDDNVVERNHITAGRGRWLLSGIESCIILYNSDRNTLVANTFANITHFGQGVSLVLEESDYNKIYHNNFTLHLSSGFLHVVPIGADDNLLDYGNRGNYWNDYTGEDLNSDGIGDTTYSIGPDVTTGHIDQDNFPLISPCTSRYLLYCDMDHDGKVNVIDVTVVAKSFGSYPTCLPPLQWNPCADIDQNCMVNIIDISAVAMEFGKEWKYTP